MNDLIQPGLRLSDAMEALLRRIAREGPIKKLAWTDLSAARGLKRRGLISTNHMGWDILEAGQALIREQDNAVVSR